MYGRWIKLLLFLAVISGGFSYYFINEHQKSWAVSDTCMEYLRGLDNTWTSDGDVYFKGTCDLENPFSQASMEMRKRTDISSLSSAGILTTIILLIAVLISAVGRWLFTGRIR